MLLYVVIGFGLITIASIWRCESMMQTTMEELRWEICTLQLEVAKRHV